MFVAQPSDGVRPGVFVDVWFGPAVKLGAWLTTLLTVIVKVCGAEVSTPPLAVPPLSCSLTVTFAVPLTLGCAVYVSVAVGVDRRLPAGENSGLLSLVTMKFKRLA